MPVTIVCAECGTAFSVSPSVKRKYCSVACYSRVSSRRTREQAAGWRSGTSMHGSGYKLILVGKDHPMSTQNGYVLEHRLVMAEHIGRMLTADEHVHHINHDRTDNRIENLELLSRGAHSTLHNLGKSRRLDRWSRKHDACIECGTIEKAHAAHGLCVNCTRRHYVARKRELQATLKGKDAE